jgi:hypothetical protein
MAKRKDSSRTMYWIAVFIFGPFILFGCLWLIMAVGCSVDKLACP